MIKVPQIGTVATKWSTRSAGATNEYRTGVQSAGSDWQASVDNSEDNWSSGVSQAAGAHAYRNGVAGKGAHYVDRAVNVGAGRFGPGVQAAVQQYTTGMGKVLGEISQIDLPPRMAVGNNQARSTAVSDRLHQAKLQGRI